MKTSFLRFIVITVFALNSASAWNNDDLEIFDLVELINQNFYEIMGITAVRKLLRGL
jgi:DnaJ family protein C protein 1